MDLTRTVARALAGACALTLLVTACGGDTDDSADVVDTPTTEAADQTTESTEAPDETTTTVVDDGATTTEADPPDDGPDGGSGDGTEGDPDAVALAQRINLTIDDFDDGWTESPAEDDDSGRTIDECFLGTDLEGDQVGEAETGSFAYEPDAASAQIVTMQTVVLDSPETAGAVFDEFTGEAFVGCAADVMGSSFGDGGAVDVSLRIDDPAWTEDSAGLVGDVTIPNGDGAAFTGAVDLHILRTAEVVSFTATIDVGVDAIEGLLGQILATVADRHATEVR